MVYVHNWNGMDGLKLLLVSEGQNGQIQLWIIHILSYKLTWNIHITWDFDLISGIDINEHDESVRKLFISITA